MNSKTTIKTIALASFAAGAMAFFAHTSGVAHAEGDINIGVGELQECTISKSMDSSGDTDARDFLIWQRGFGSTTASTTDGDGDVDGRDFLAWQRGDSPAPIATSDLAAWQTNYGSGY